MKYATLYPVLWIALLILCILLTYLTVCTVRYYQAAAQVKRLEAQVFDLSDEGEYLLSSANISRALVDSVEADNGRLADDNDTLRKDISEMEDELTSSRAERRPFDPKEAGASRVLAQIVAAECGPTATYAECRMVAQVIINRSKRSGASLLATITAPGQFTPVSSGAWLWATPTPVEMAAAYNAVNRIDDVARWGDASTKMVLYFCAAGHEDEFFKTKLVLDRRIGDTAFYREKEG